METNVKENLNLVQKYRIFSDKEILEVHGFLDKATKDFILEPVPQYRRNDSSADLDTLVRDLLSGGSYFDYWSTVGLFFEGADEPTSPSQKQEGSLMGYLERLAINNYRGVGVDEIDFYARFHDRISSIQSLLTWICSKRIYTVPMTSVDLHTALYAGNLMVVPQTIDPCVYVHVDKLFLNTPENSISGLILHTEYLDKGTLYHSMARDFGICSGGLLNTLSVTIVSSEPYRVHTVRLPLGDWSMHTAVEFCSLFYKTLFVGDMSIFGIGDEDLGVETAERVFLPDLFGFACNVLMLMDKSKDSIFSLSMKNGSSAPKYWHSFSDKGKMAFGRSFIEKEPSLWFVPDLGF